MTTIPAFCMPWHTSVSNAFQEILVQPLRHLLDISLTPWDQTPALPMEHFARDPGRPLIFCQLPPPPELLREKAARIIWLPMWDNVEKWPLSFWKNLPAHLRIVAYSKPVQERAERFGLPTLRVRFFFNPQQYATVRADGPAHSQRTMIYWNRVGLYSFRALRRICRDLEVQRLIHILRPDPGYDHPGLALPAAVGRTEVTTIRSFLPDSEHQQLLDQSHLCLAPRPCEGVGLTVLQSMVRGACVLAYDAPSTNEYVAHGRNGYLFRSLSPTGHKWRKSLGKRWHRLMGRTEVYHYHMIGSGQIGRRLDSIDPDQLGKAARADHEAGYSLWQEGLAGYADFLTRW